MIKTKQMSLYIFLKQHLAGSLLKKQMKSTLEETIDIVFICFFKYRKHTTFYFVSLKIVFLMDKLNFVSTKLG